MRLIFFTLVGLNLLVAVWGLFLRQDVAPELERSESPLLESKVKTITAAVTDMDLASPPPGQESEQSSPAPQSLCELVGAFASDEDAGIFVERLRSIDIESSIEHVELTSGASYWVHLPAEETSAAAFRRLAELQALKIESYVIGRGDLKNSVSLGVFTREALAISKRDEILGMGFDPVITTKPRTEIEIWVSIQPDFAEKISDLTWKGLLNDLSSQERRQNFCLPVASDDNIH